MEIRTLRREERAAWLELLDGWELTDGWRGRDFFQRPVDHDPSYADANVWVAAEGGELVSAVQIFPRLLRVGGAEVPTGGIGSVYTRPESRATGVASALLERAVADMRARGMELSLLFAIRLAFYERLGWRSWQVPRELLRAEGAPPPALEPEPFDPERDLDALTALHAETRAGLCGPAARTAEEWRASLVLAGNPAEEFLVARGGDGGIRAYVRALHLNAALVVGEHGGRDAEALAALLRGLLEPRAEDPLASPDRSSAELRSFAVLPGPAPPPLAAALEAVGVSRTPVEDPTVMLRCLDAAALGRRIGARPGAGEDTDAFLRRVLPPDRFLYWPADRF